MRRMILLSFIFLLSTVWAAAQYGGTNGKTPNATLDTSRVTIVGCLGGAVGEFTLTDRSGTIYQLTGNTEKMNAHVGHTVRVTGIRPSGGAMPGSMSEDTGSETPPALSVISFEHVSPTCDDMQGNDMR
jgi:hypothetical protein